MQQPPKELQKLQNEIKPILQQFEAQVGQVSDNTHEQCIQNNPKDADKYADCMIRKSKVINKWMNSFQFRIMFMQHSFETCLKNSNNGDKCVDECKKKLESYINEFKQKIN